jgi:hypothetical protein
MGQMRLIGSMGILLAGLLLASPSPTRSTAVFTLEAQHRVLLDGEDNPISNQLDRWAEPCQIGGDGPAATLDCPSSPTAPEPAAESPGREVPATLVLFRDLDETVYLAGCPFVETDPASEADSRSETTAKGFKPEDLRNCKDLAAGQTFSSEVEDGRLRIVIRGQQLALKVYEVREKPTGTDTPYLSTPSRRLPPTGPPTRGERVGLEPQTPPKWEPPQTPAPTAGKASERRLSGVAPAHTSLRTGHLTVECASRQAEILIDGAYLGACPVTTLLIAGPHTVNIQQAGKAEQVRDIEIEAGKTLRLHVGP